MTDLSDRLDAALAGRIPADVDTAPLLAALSGIESLREVPPRSTASAQSGLRAFLDQAAAAQPADSPPASRRKRWASKRLTGGSPMFAAVRLALILALSLIGAGAVTVAAQGSLPSDALYPIKLASEDVRLALAGGDRPQIDVLLKLAAVRTQEMARLAEAGWTIPEDVPLRLQTHLDMALQAAARLDDPQMQAALEQMQTAVRAQEQVMFQARRQTSGETARQLQTAEQIAARTRELCALGLSQPQLFRERVTSNRPEAAPDQPETTPGQGGGSDPRAEPCDDCTPQGEQNQEQQPYGPQPTGQLENGSGPQATPCDDCTPQGDRNQEQHPTAPVGQPGGPGTQAPDDPCNGGEHSPQSTPMSGPGSGGEQKSGPPPSPRPKN